MTTMTIRRTALFLLVLLDALTVGCSTAPGESNSETGSIVYLSKPQTGGMFVAYLTTELRGEDLQKQLATELRAHCRQAPLLNRYRITIFSDEAAARAALAGMGKIPDRDSADFTAVQRATLASYEPETGVLKIRRAITTRADDWSTLGMGNDWCKGA